MIAMPEGVRYDAKGLVPVVIQDADSGEVLTLAWMNAESLALTVQTGETWLWSRSRAELWHKGATSGNTQQVVALGLDCDGDALVARVRPRGPACHEGTRSCFAGVAPPLRALEDRLAQRAAERPAGSYAVRLLDDPNLRFKKLGEEAVEVVLAATGGSDADLAGEAADLVFHLIVVLRARGLGWDDVVRVLAARHAVG